MARFFDHLRDFGLCALALAAAAFAAQPAAAQREIEAPGPYLHRPAKAVFAEKVGAFSRISVNEYDAQGRDVSASYDLATPQGRIVVTAYIYPAPEVAGSGDSKRVARVQLCGRHFDEIHKIIANRNGNARPLEQGRGLAVPDVPVELSHRYTYRYRAPLDDREQDVRSEAHLYCYVGGDWLVKYRVTAPAAADGQAEIADFIRRGPWPGRDSPETIALAF
jgi:hypothetical protein